MCYMCGCTALGGNYVLDTAEVRNAGAVAVPDESGRALAGPEGADVQATAGRLPDGRAGSVVPTEQAPWGWGLAPARSSEAPGDALSALEENPHGYSLRQQLAVRRDLGAEIGEYVDYEGRPYAGQVEPAGMPMIPGLDSEGRF